jgi:hypothetical protein
VNTQEKVVNMYVSTRLNKKDAAKFREIARKLGISEYKLLTILVKLLLEEPEIVNKIKEKLGERNEA